MDYRALLKAYMELVLDAEGITFLDDCYHGYEPPEMTAEQKAELREIEGEIVLARTQLEK